MNQTEALAQAAQFLRAGQLPEAERLYLEILRADPGNGRARHFLGIVRFHQGRNAEALDLIGVCLKTDPGAELRAHYANVLQAMGRFDEALASYDQALKIKPELVSALYSRGVTLTTMRRLDEALASYDKALALVPDDAGVWINRGIVLLELKRPGEALAATDKALAIEPGFAEAWNNRGIALQELGRLEEALASYDKALSIRPDYAEAYNSRGLVLKDLKRHTEAEASLARAVALSPDYAEAWNNYGAVFQSADRPDEALTAYGRALALKPDYIEALFNKAYVQGHLRRFEEALAGYDGILHLAPDHARAWNQRGSILYDMQRFEEAMASFDRALSLQPDYAEVLSRRGNMRWARKQDLDGAIGDLEKAVTADPDYEYALGDLLYLRMQACDWRAYEQQVAVIDAKVRAGKRVIQPLYYLAVSDSPADLQRCSRIYAEHLYPSAPAFPPVTSRAHRKIRIAYLCGEFREHPIGYLTAGLFEQHDKTRFEIIALDSGWDDGSPTRKRHEAAFDKFFDVSRLSDRMVAEKIRAEEIDILVDVNGYTRNHRIGVFAQKPAPIQVEYLGFPGTLGAPYMDYVIADRWLIPESERQFYAESVVWLPDTYQANDSRRPAPLPPPSRAECGLPGLRSDSVGNAFVFCNFNQNYKLTPAMFAVWMRILKKAEGSVLWLLEGSKRCCENLRREAAAQGVAPERIVFAPPATQEKHLARTALADLSIDTLPYNAHTTASDALWVGLPLVTCCGNAFAGRVAASLLNAIGLPELVAENLEDYEALILKLAGDPVYLNSMRAKLAARRLSTPLFDTGRYARHIESAYTTMWDRWYRGEPAQGFAVRAET